MTEFKALGTTTNTRAELNDIYGDMIINTINEKAVLFNLFPRVKNESDYARWVLRTSSSGVAGPTSEFADLSAGYQTRVKAYAQIKIYQNVIEVSDFLQLSHRGAGGIGADILTQEIADGASELLSSMNGDVCVTSSDSNAFLSIQEWVDDTTPSTIAGLTRASYSALQGNVIAGGSAKITKAKLREAIRTPITYGANANSQVIVCHPLQRDFILELMDPSQRFMTTVVDFGFRKEANVPMFDGVPIITDKDLTNSELYVLDMSSWELKELEGERIVPLAKTALTDKVAIVFYGELICKIPYHNSKIESLATS